MKRILVVMFVVLTVAGTTSVGAGQLGTGIPPNCVAHTSFNGSADLVDDYRCAGLAIEFHTAGVAFSPGPIWAGQWLFVDDTGQFRVGSCTFNRGIHPTIDAPSSVVAQQFPNDPTGAKGAYLTWRYGDTTDNLTAAAMWAVFHYYAQDSAGARRASNPVAPLIPSLDGVAQASGRDDLQAAALQLDAEAARFAGEWSLTASVDVDGNIEAQLLAAGEPVANAGVTVLVSGQDAPVAATTDADGTARSTMPVSPGTMTIVASTPAPGQALVYRGRPAGPDPYGAQRLVTGGIPRILTVTATVDVPVPTTTTTSTTTTTTTLPETTTSTTTTTTLPETTTSTVPETTTTTTLPPETIPAATSTLPADTTVPAPAPAVEALPPPPPPAPPLPKTGKGSQLISYLGTSLLVAGIGIVGAASRRPRRRVIYTR